METFRGVAGLFTLLALTGYFSSSASESTTKTAKWVSERDKSGAIVADWHINAAPGYLLSGNKLNYGPGGARTNLDNNAIKENSHTGGLVRGESNQYHRMVFTAESPRKNVQKNDQKRESINPMYAYIVEFKNRFKKKRQEVNISSQKTGGLSEFRGKARFLSNKGIARSMGTHGNSDVGSVMNPKFSESKIALNKFKREGSQLANSLRSSSSLHNVKSLSNLNSDNDVDGVGFKVVRKRRASVNSVTNSDFSGRQNKLEMDLLSDTKKTRLTNSNFKTPTKHDVIKRRLFEVTTDSRDVTTDSALSQTTSSNGVFNNGDSFAYSSGEPRHTLYIGGLFELTGDKYMGNGYSELDAALMAVKDINKQEVIPGYKLEMLHNDSKCDPGVGTDAFFDMIYRKSNGSSLIMALGSACTEVTKTIAEIVPYWNLLLLSYAAKSPALSEREKYRTFFRLALGDSALNPARRMLIKHFLWDKVAALYEDLESLSLAFNGITKDFTSHGITIKSSSAFKDAKVEVPGMLKELKDQDVRIILAGFLEPAARQVFCEAYRQGMYGARYVWILVGGFKHQWWLEPGDTSCTLQELSQALEGAFTVFSSDGLLDGGKSVANLTSTEFLESYLRHNGARPLSLFAASTYDSVWTIALTIQQAILKWEANGTAPPLHELNYDAMGFVKETFISTMEDLEFPGVSGPVSFKGSDREGISVIYQVQGGNFTQIALHQPTSPELEFECVTCHPIVWEGGRIPKDEQMVVLRMKTIQLSVLYTTASLCLLGIVLAICVLIYNLYHRRLKFIKLSSPKLNNVAVIGCILVYAAVILLGLDDRMLSEESFTIICTGRVFLLAAGFSLAFGAMFAKTFRVHQIFTRAHHGLVKSKLLQDTHLLVIIGVLLAVDSAMVFVWVFVDPMSRHISNTTAEVSAEDEDMIYQEQLTTCHSDHMQKWLGAFYAYKGLLLVFGVYMAWETRHVKIPALNDSQYIGLNVYNVVIMSVSVVVISNILSSQPTLAYAMEAAFIILSTTVTLCLLFIPKIYAIVTSGGNPVIAGSGILVDQTNCRRFVFDDRKEIYYRAEVQNRVYKRELIECDQKIARLERLLELPLQPYPKLTEELLYLLPESKVDGTPKCHRRFKHELERCNSISDGGEGVTYDISENEDILTEMTFSLNSPRQQNASAGCFAKRHSTSETPSSSHLSVGNISLLKKPRSLSISSGPGAQLGGFGRWRKKSKDSSNTEESAGWDDTDGSESGRRSPTLFLSADRGWFKGKKRGSEPTNGADTEQLKKALNRYSDDLTHLRSGIQDLNYKAVSTPLLDKVTQTSLESDKSVQVNELSKGVQSELRKSSEHLTKSEENRNGADGNDSEGDSDDDSLDMCELVLPEYDSSKDKSPSSHYVRLSDPNNYKARKLFSVRQLHISSVDDDDDEDDTIENVDEGSHNMLSVGKKGKERRKGVVLSPRSAVNVSCIAVPEVRIIPNNGATHREGSSFSVLGKNNGYGRLSPKRERSNTDTPKSPSHASNDDRGPKSRIRSVSTPERPKTVIPRQSPTKPRLLSPKPTTVPRSSSAHKLSPTNHQQCLLPQYIAIDSSPGTSTESVFLYDSPVSETPGADRCHSSNLSHSQTVSPQPLPPPPSPPSSQLTVISVHRQKDSFVPDNSSKKAHEKIAPGLDKLSNTNVYAKSQPVNPDSSSAKATLLSTCSPSSLLSPAVQSQSLLSSASPSSSRPKHQQSRDSSTKGRQVYPSDDDASAISLSFMPSQSKMDSPDVLSSVENGAGPSSMTGATECLIRESPTGASEVSAPRGSRAYVTRERRFRIQKLQEDLVRIQQELQDLTELDYDVSEV